MRSPRVLARMPLLGQVCLVNGAVLVAATALLLLSPVGVTADVARAEVAVVLTGLAVVLALNALLLRTPLAPVDRLVRGAHAMLDRLEAEQRASSARALAAQEAERHRIAQELHDQVGQSLTVVLLGLKQVQQHAPSELLAELQLVRDSTRAALDDVRRVARQLRPGVLEDLGLSSALAALCSEFEAHGTARVRRTVAPGLPPLSSDVELVLYRVAQEALTNAARHAGAQEVTVSLTRLGDAVVLEVCDDGRDGPGSVVPGAGVSGMHERALLVGGVLQVEGGAAAGTRVRLVVPLDRAGSS